MSINNNVRALLESVAVSSLVYMLKGLLEMQKEVSESPLISKGTVAIRLACKHIETKFPSRRGKDAGESTGRILG
jgi:hypothetical protein